MALFGPPDIPKLKEKRDLNGLVKALNYQKAPAIPRAAFDALFDLKEGIKACYALGNHGDPALAVPLLKLALELDFDKKTIGLRNAAINALEAHHWQPDKSLAAACFWVGKENFENCAEIGELAVPPLNAALREWKAHSITAHRSALRKMERASRENNIIRLIRVLGRIGGLDAAKSVGSCLLDDYSQVRQEAVDAIVRIGDPAVSTLIRYLPAAAAAEALGRIGSREAVKPLLDAVENAPKGYGGEKIKIKALEALGRIGDETAIDKLVYYASYPLGEVQQAAQTGLKAFGQKPAPALVDLLKEASANRQKCIAETLAALRWRPGKDKLGATYWAALQDWENCARIGDTAVEVLVEALENHLGTRQNLVQQLALYDDSMDVYMNDDSPGHSTYQMEMREKEQKRAALTEAKQGVEKIVKSLAVVTGEDFGEDVDAWHAWWAENRPAER